MRPLRLEMQAFGPYRDVQTLDFTELGTNRLFLIHGETGAGKTSILDAMVFALYGDTSGGERQASQMRCESAAPDLPTQVSFEFALGERRFRAVRRPKQDLAAKRDARTVTKQAEAAMWEITDAPEGTEGKLLASKIRDVDIAVRDLLGFSSEQFRQVVVLPQGKFRDLLTAGSDKREEILRQLFKTERYGAIEHRLTELAREVIRAREAGTMQMTAVLESAQVATRDELRDLIESAAQLLESGADRERVAKDASELAARRLQSAQDAQRAHANLDEARQVLEALQARAPEIAAVDERLVRARHARAVEPAIRAFTQSQSALAQAQLEATQSAEQERRALEAAKSAEQAAENLGQRRTQRDAQTARVAQLVDLENKALDVAAARAHTDGLLAARDAALSEAAAAATSLGETREALAAQEQAAGVQEAAAAQLEQLQARKAQAQAHVEAAIRRVQAQEALDAASAYAAETTTALECAQQTFDEAVRCAGEAEEAWRAARAALLAHELIPGEACPVCGSHDHPAPAQGDADVSDAALDDARGRLQEASRARDEAANAANAAAAALAQATGVLDALESAPGSESTLAAAEQELASCQSQVAQLESSLLDADALATRLSTARAAVERAEQVAREAAERADAADSAAREAQMRADTLAESLSSDLQDATTIAAAIASTRLQLQELEQSIAADETARESANVALASARTARESADEAIARAQERLEAARTELDSALGQHGFASVEEAQIACVAEDELTAREAALAQYRDEVNRAHGRLEEATRAVAVAGSVGDIAALQVAAQEACGEFEQAQSSQAALKARLTQLEHAEDRLRQLDRDLVEIDVRYGVIGRLAEVASGQGGSAKISFQRWVLGTYLDDVLEAANRRLAGMSRGRYALERQRDATDRKRPAGLELAVFDSWSNRSRPAVTLSGGESFLAAMALALGLAETVQEESGGTHLETVFIDEGFGALDSDALDLAVDALMELKANGRLVGVISHVPELRQVIDARLEVTTGTQGSQARFAVS